MNEAVKLSTIDEIRQVVTPENIDVFIEDFKSFLMLDMFVKGSKQPIGNITNFTWIDDSKNEATINFIADEKSIGSIAVSVEEVTQND